MNHTDEKMKKMSVKTVFVKMVLFFENRNFQDPSFMKLIRDLIPQKVHNMLQKIL